MVAPFTPGQVPCSYHPDVMTGLRCNRCGKPICPRCAVRTPVGMRCPDCAGVRGLPTYRTPPSVLIQATAAGLLVAVLFAVLWRFGPQWNFYLTLLLGFGSVEVMARVANQKRGPDLQVMAILVVTVGLVLSRYLLIQRYSIPWEAVNQMTRGVPELLRLQLVPDIAFMAIAYVIAWYRFR